MPTPNPKRQKYEHLWLDLLPIDIRERITCLLPSSITDRGINSQFFPDVLSLSSVSAVQAVTVGKQTHMSIEHANSPQHTSVLIRAWLDVLREIVSIHLPVEATDNEEAKQVLSLQSIRKVSVPNYPFILRQLPKLHFLRFVELRLTRYCPMNGQRGLSTGLSTVLRTCPIQDMRIICLGCNNCPHLPCLAVGLMQPLKIGRQCATLKSFMVKCASEHMEALAQSPVVFPNLEFFHLEHWVSVDHLFLDRAIQIHLSEAISAILQKVKNVTINNCGSVGSFLPVLAQNLSGISSVIEVTPLDLALLGVCTNLRSIDLLLQAGTEVQFPPELQTLRSLSLTWLSKKVLDLHEKYYSPPFGIISEIVRRNSDLEELKLKSVNIPCDLLEDLLVTLASKLRRLQLPVLHQGETPSCRVLRLGRLLLRHNHKLKTLHLCGDSLRKIAKLPVMMKHEMRICGSIACVLCDLKRKVESLRGLLTRRYSGFCDVGLQEILFELEPLC